MMTAKELHDRNMAWANRVSLGETHLEIARKERVPNIKVWKALRGIWVAQLCSRCDQQRRIVPSLGCCAECFPS